jgi:iron complex outermembrane receptor protein
MKGLDDDLADLTQEHSYNFFNPKAGVTFAITPQQRAYVSFAVGHREPTRADIKDALKYGGTVMPRPETLYDAEAGYELNNDVWTIGVNGFYMYYIDQLVNTGKLSDSGYALMENVPDSYRTGLELTVGVCPVKALQINGNMAYSRNKIKDYTAYVDATTADGASLPQREERLDVLKEKCAAFGIHEADLWWYLDTRKFGTVPHAGFGLGFERMIMFVTGMTNIRDVIPFPRTPGNAEF